MPRIAAAFGLIAIIAVSIGLNIMRYPKVWEMAHPSAYLAQPDDSSHSDPPDAAENTKPETHPPTAVIAKKSDSKKKSPKKRKKPADSVEPMEDLVEADVDYGQYTTAADASDPYASTADDRWEEDRSDEMKPLPDCSDDKVRRLPPVDPNAPSGAKPYVPRSQGSPIPFYPTTGV